jgi:hypothetical protein
MTIEIPPDLSLKTIHEGLDAFNNVLSDLIELKVCLLPLSPFDTSAFPQDLHEPGSGTLIMSSFACRAVKHIHVL